MRGAIKRQEERLPSSAVPARRTPAAVIPAPGPVAVRRAEGGAVLSRAEVLRLQRTVGNRVVTRMLAPRGADAAAIQRAKSTAATNGGVFTADPYEALPSGAAIGSTGKKVSGARMRLRFTPGFPVVGRVGLVQAVKRYITSGSARRAVGRNDKDEKVALPVTGKEKAFIDVNRLEGKPGARTLASNLPLYGQVPAQQIESGAPASLAEAPEGPTMGSSNLSQTGSRTDKGATVDAIVDDLPHGPITSGHEVSFETAAIVLDGALANTYLGTVRWGYTAAENAAATLNPNKIEVVSLGVPSSTFMEAAEAWNAQGPVHDEVRDKDFDTVKLPKGSGMGPSSFEDIITPSGSAALGWAWLLDHAGHVLLPRTGGKDKVAQRNRNLQRLLLIREIETKLVKSAERLEEIEKEVKAIVDGPDREPGLKAYLVQNEIPKLQREAAGLKAHMVSGQKAAKALTDLQLDIA